MKNRNTSHIIFIILLTIICNHQTFSQTVEARINQLISQMTIEEKVSQLYKAGAMHTADNTRLKIPGFVMADGPHGVRDGLATSFPVGIGMAATFDVELAEQVGVALGKEFRGKGKHQALGPAMDMTRDPRNGRTPESGGEDPYLNALINSSVIKGMQSAGIIATAKHYNGKHQQINRNGNDYKISQRNLLEHYGLNFRTSVQDAGAMSIMSAYNRVNGDQAAESSNLLSTILRKKWGFPGLNFRTSVQEAGAMSIMSAYNRVNGDQAAESSNLLSTILRKKWGFPFYVVSDWGAVHTSEKAIKAGTDICMGSDNYENDLLNLVNTGKVTVGVIDEAVRRVLRTKIMTGMLDYLPLGNPSDVNSPAHQALCLEAGKKSIVLLKNQNNILPLNKNSINKIAVLPLGNPSDVNSPAHQALCLEAGKKSIVLLKNQNNILPLNKNSINKIAVLGPNAAIMQTDGSGSSWVTPFYTVTPKQGIENYVGPQKVLYAKGVEISGGYASDLGTAMQYVTQADVVIYFGGLDPSQEGEGFDRTNGSIELPGRQKEFINLLTQYHQKVIVVLISGGICGVNSFINDIEGLIHGFYPGQEGGNAIAQVLFGDYNPAGRLPVTIPKNDSQLPTEITDFNFDNDYGCGYRWFDEKGLVPEFPFGFGLSYTTFSYSNIKVNTNHTHMGNIVEVSVDVKNTGTRSGEEVVQLYLTENPSYITKPKKELKGFKRVFLDVNETKTVTFQITPNELYHFNQSSNS